MPIPLVAPVLPPVQNAGLALFVSHNTIEKEVARKTMGMGYRTDADLLPAAGVSVAGIRFLLV